MFSFHVAVRYTAWLKSATQPSGDALSGSPIDFSYESRTSGVRAVVRQLFSEDRCHFIRIREILYHHCLSLCDIDCCHAGFLTGFCLGKVTVGVGIAGPSPNGGSQYKPTINVKAGCECKNDIRDATCGPDGSFIGIRCPFDKSACARKCCREGRRSGSCGGFLKLKCKCD